MDTLGGRHHGTDGRALAAAVAAVLARLDTHATTGGPAARATGPGASGVHGVPGVRGASGGPGASGASAASEADDVSGVRRAPGGPGTSGGASSASGGSGADDVPGMRDASGAFAYPDAPGASGTEAPVAGGPGDGSRAGGSASGTSGTDSADDAAAAASGAAAVRGGSAADGSGAEDAAAAGPAVPAGDGGVTADGHSALDALVSCFGLSAFERDVLVLTAAAELDSTTGSRCAAASGDPNRTYPTFSLALAALADPHWSALTPVAPLRRWRLIELDDENRLTGSRLRIDERVLHFLAGVPYLDSRLHGLLRRAPAPSAGELPEPYRRAAERIESAWSAAGIDEPPRAEIVGGDRRTRTDLAAAAARRAGLGLYTVAAGDLPTDPVERDRLARLWQREAVLLPAALLLEVGEPDREQAAATEAFIAATAVPLVVSGQDPRPAGQRLGERVTVPALSPEEQLRTWAEAFRDVPEVSTEDLRVLVAQFSLPPHVIRSAAATVRRDAGTEGTGAGLDATELAWRAGLGEARIALDELGRRIEPEAGWDDLVLHERQLRILREIVAHVRQRGTVYQEWGFESVLRRGLGVTALFSGGSGTGKTLAAEVVAKELGLDLFVIDLSQVVSKYIGETEKNLRRVFDAAERGGALLLFDEADALFGKRSEVKDSHDRYANLEVSYLLMRMEAYRGLAILTTNMKKALDNAFMRRIRFAVDFPFPGVPERAEIWRRVLPERAPTKNLDVQRLAQLTVAGGSIRNIALSGAFLAAEEGVRLQMRHMLAAARTEYLKLERSLTPAEVQGWV